MKKNNITMFEEGSTAMLIINMKHFWNPKWTSTFAQNSKKIYKRNQDEPKRAIMSFKESNNCL